MKISPILTTIVCLIFLSCSKSKNGTNNPTGTQFTCGTILTVTHTAGSVAPVTKTVKYGTVSSSLSGTSKCWLTQNLGADHPATTFNDSSRASAGWYFQFNRKQGYVSSVDTATDILGYKYYQYLLTPASAWVSQINESADWQSANDPCTLLLGTGWRLPTQLEIKTVLANGGWTTGDAAYGSIFNFHSSYLNTDTTYNTSYSLDYGAGYFWSSNQHDASSGWALYLTDASNEVNNIESPNKKNAYPIRCIKD